ncbi:latrophilin Cirl-like isoform X2 [Argiope bruennichi]|uniref:latrophilin Cirl-like isoform X2 n=1 Tax=Argiope bruennichi TaxID=94029 RepID=UPI0024952BEF|nr:latrophilin Cirl-like isoform X2 [Argiope bruennichi]
MKVYELVTMAWVYKTICILMLGHIAYSTGARRGGDRHQSKTTYSCEGNELHVGCEEGKVIRLIRANYGRFSISMCNDNGHMDWSVDCISYRSFLIMQDKCHQKPSCGIGVSSSIFGDPCPGTLKYLEVQYQCVSPSFFTSTTRKSAILTNSSSPADSDSVPETTLGTVLETSGGPDGTVPATSPASSSSTSSSSTSTSTTTTTQKYSQESVSLVTSTSRAITELSTTEKPTTATSIPPNHCPPITMNDIHWNWTRAGTQAIHRCPGGATGLARWQCADDPIRWLTPRPDLRECRSGWVINLKKRIESGESINNVATELSLMTYIKPLYADDLKDIAEVIQQTLSRAINGMENFHDLWHRYHVLRELLQSLVETISNLLKQGTTAWNDLSSSDRRRVASSLLDGLEESAMLLAHSSGKEDSFTLAEANILLSVQVLSARTQAPVQFPVSDDFREVSDTAWIRMDDTLVLPPQTLLDISKHGLAKVVFVVYTGIGDLLKPEPGFTLRSSKGNSSWRINSKVIAASVGKPGNTKLSQPIVITFRHLEEENMTNPMCVFWDFDSREWSSMGCWVQASNTTHTSCACNHLTNFAVMMEVAEVKEAQVPSDVLHVTITVGCGICIVCLLATVIPIFLLRSLIGDSVTVHRNMFFCLLSTEIVLVFGIEQVSSPIVCAVLAAVLDYLLLATFCWAFLECFQLYVELADISQPQKSRWIWYYALAYSVPALIVTVAAAVDNESYGTDRLCWLRSDNYFIFSFIGPAVGIFFGGVVFLCVAACILYHHSGLTTTIKGKEEAKLTKLKCHIRRAVLLMCLLGLTWTTGLLYLHQETLGFAYAFTILNSIQGIFILLFYCLTDEKIQPELERLGECSLLGSLHRSKGNLPPPAALTPGSPGQHSEVCQEVESPIKQGNCSVNLTSTTLGPLYTTSTSNPIQENHSAEIPKVQKEFYGPLQKGAEIYNQNSGPAVDHQESPCKVWLPYEWQRRMDRQYLGTGDLYGPFSEHIYESVDGDYGYSGHPRSLGGEYCYRSDVSQHSSSSYGYDQRPLLILPRHPGHSEYGTGRRHSPEKHRRRHRNHRRSVDDTAKAENVSTVVIEQDQVTNEIERNDQQNGEHEWNLPDLLRCPVDNTVVMAVLDGEKVVSRVQPECPHYNLSTYC